MASWKLAPALVVLRDEINKEWPLRDKTSDGSLGNAAHSARYSDHNPNANRVVCAIDIDEDLEGSKSDKYPRFNPGTPAKSVLVDVLVRLAKEGKLPQLYYVIYERKIYQRKYGFAPRPYNGANAHDHHVHVSVSQNPSLYNKTTPWNITKELPKFLPVYLVDPEKVSTTLTGNAPEGKEDVQRKPLFEITTGVRFDGKWLVTSSGYRYHKDYLILKSEYEKKQAAAKTEVKKPSPAPAGFTPGKYKTTVKANGHAAPDAQSKVILTVPANTVIGVGSWAGEADGHRWVKDTMGRYWNYWGLKKVT